MYKFTNSLNNIYSYQAQNNQFIYLKKKLSGGGLFLNDKCIFEDEVESFIYDSENIVFTTSQQNTFIYDILSNTLELLFENHGIGEIFFSRHRIDLYRWNNNSFSNYDRLFYDYLNQEIIFENSIVPTHEVNGGLLFEQITHTTLKSINLETDTYNWEVDLSEYCKVITVSNEIAQGMIRQVFGVFEDKLWIGFDQSKYAALDLATGKVITFFKLSDIDADLERAGVLFPYFDAQRGLLCFLENRDYVEISLSNLSIHRRKSFDTGNPETDWNFSSNTFDDTNVYFTATRANSRFSPNYVGVFDRKTMEITWSQDLELYKQPSIADMPDRFLAQAPQSDGNKLYVLDTHNTLHIFEKTEEN